MDEPFIGEIRVFPYQLIPQGWAPCKGQLLKIEQNKPLFSLIGHAFGGDGENFALPDLSGRVPIAAGNGRGMGATGGAENHALTLGEMPVHTHAIAVSTEAGTSDNPAGRFLGRADALYHAPPPQTGLHPETIGLAGAGQKHTNMQPFLALRFCIALQGLFPSRP